MAPSSGGSGSRGTGPGRSAQRVPVFFFPKRARPHALSPSGRTVTLPLVELPTVEAAEPVTESYPTPERGGRRGRSKASPPKRVGRKAEPKVPKESRRRTRRKSHEALFSLCLEGHRLFERGDLEGARGIFEELVSLGLSDPFPHTMLGTVYLALGDQAGALGQFERALELDPQDVPARAYRGEIQLNRGRVTRALSDLRRVLELGAAEDPFVKRARRLLRVAEAALPARRPGRG